VIKFFLQNCGKRINIIHFQQKNRKLELRKTHKHAPKDIKMDKIAIKLTISRNPNGCQLPSVIAHDIS